MFEVKNIIGNTYYFEGFTNVGIYRPDEKRVILIDSSEHKRLVKAILNYLSREELIIDRIICTHCHIDHICGNKTFHEKYGCRIFSTEKEKHFIAEPDLESTFYYAGIDTDKTRNPFFMVEPAVIETLTEEDIPDGFEIISLPGHSFDMIGIRTPDNVLFLADSILSEKTWEQHKMPFFHDVNESVKTLEMIKGLEAEVYVPSHNEPLTDIISLADHNITKLKELKDTVYGLCEETGFDDLFAELMKRLDLKIRKEKYSSYAVMLRNVLQSLVEDEKICGIMKDGRFVYIKK